mmetsp:Transcript_22864/g.50088  ORF Transcript_22864/g.50088 Transcript_22864/m.50088 type:complete len:271 (-) Transcript_22864:216-1028(-)
MLTLLLPCELIVAPREAALLPATTRCELPLHLAGKAAAWPGPTAESLGIGHGDLAHGMVHECVDARVWSVGMPPISSVHWEPPWGVVHLLRDRGVHLGADEGLHGKGPTEALGLRDVARALHELSEAMIADLEGTNAEGLHHLLVPGPLSITGKYRGVALIIRHEAHRELTTLQVDDRRLFQSLAGRAMLQLKLCGYFRVIWLLPGTTDVAKVATLQTPATAGAATAAAICRICIRAASCNRASAVSIANRREPFNFRDTTLSDTAKSCD